MSFRLEDNSGNGGGSGGIWTPTISDVEVNNSSTADIGTLVIAIASYTGGPDAKHFELQFYHTPANAVSSYFFTFTLPTDIGDISDFYGDAKYSAIEKGIDRIYGVQSGGTVEIANPTDTPPFTKARVVTYFGAVEITPDIRFGAVRGILVL